MMNQRPSRVLCIVSVSAALSAASLAACGTSDSPAPQSSAGTSGSSTSPAGSSAGGALPSAGATGVAGATLGGGGSSAGSSGATGSAGASAGAGGIVSGGGSGQGGASTAGASGTGGGATIPESPPGFFTDGYLMRTPWMGYMFTIVDALGSMVSPVCDTTGCTPAWGTQPCASGTVAKDPASASFAGLAFHANDPMGGTRGTWTSTGAGVYISVANPPASARLQLQEQKASADTRYCAPLPAGGTGMIPWASFKTYCWGDAAHPSKVFAVGTAIHEVTVIIPGNSTAAQMFNFCLVDIQPR